MRASVWIAVLLGLVTTTGIARPLASQTIRVRVVAGDPERPVAGALLSLQTESGRRVAQTLTDETGRAVLQTPGPGSYRIRADRIGYSGTVTEPFTLEDAAPASMVVTMPDTRVLLPELTVRSTRRACRLDTESGTALATVWDEARKALTGTRLTRTVQPPELDVTTFEQELDRRDRVTGERSHTERRRVTAPFVTPDPARLIERGFVEERDGDLWFSAPDADLLLSDEFVEVHCFWIARGERPDTGLVGLAFEPAGGRRVPEVKGTLWLDRASAELRFLEFTYVNLDRSFSTGGEGGRLAFQRLPAGGWIVSEWSIRTPIVARIRGRGLDGLPLERDSLLGHRETGGRATVVAAGAAPTGAVVTGVVFDSMAGAPLDGAVVSVGGGAYADTTDASGRFRIEAPNQGNFIVTAEHRTITLLGLGRLTGAARLARGAVANLDFSVPPLERAAPELCANVSIDAGGSAIVAGFLRDSTGALAPETTFEFLWRGSTPGPRQVTLTSDSQGIYRLCGLAPNARIWLRSSGGLVPTPGSIAVAGNPLTLTDVTLVPAHRVAAPASITVVVRDSTRGTVVDGALLVLLPAGDSTRTDAQGVGRFSRVRTGAILVAVRALGYGDGERQIVVAAGDTAIEISVPPSAVTLAALEVSARPAGAAHPQMAGFETRRREANGHFFTLEQLKPLERSPLSGALRQALGVRLVPRPSPCSGYAAASGRRSPASTHLCQDAGFVPACYLAVYYNGSVFWREGTGEPPPDIDQFRVDDLEAVEVYVGPSQVPATFQITGSTCGAIVLWPRVTTSDD